MQIGDKIQAYIVTATCAVVQVKATVLRVVVGVAGCTIDIKTNRHGYYTVGGRRPTAWRTREEAQAIALKRIAHRIRHHEKLVAHWTAMHEQTTLEV